MYKRIVTKGHLPYCYLKVKLEFENEHSEPEIEPAMFKYIITQAIQSLHGEFVPLEPQNFVPLLVHAKWFVSEDKPDDPEVELEEIGASNNVDVLKYQKRKLEAILKVHHSFMTKLWSSLTLHSSFHGQVCAFRVLQVSSHLMALSANSRELDVT